MNEQIVEAVAQAICRQPGSLCVGFCHEKRCKRAIEYHCEDARTAIRASAPFILDMAKKEWTDSWTIFDCRIAALKERFDRD